MPGPPRNWGTMVQDLLERSARPSATHGTLAKRSICQAIEFMDRSQDNYLAESRFALRTTQGKVRYAPGEGAEVGPPKLSGVPVDLQEILGSLTLLPLGDASSECPIDRETTEALEDGTWGGLFGDTLSTAGNISLGQPRRFAWYLGELYLAPAADSPLHIVRGRYRRALGVPFAAYVSAAWKFYKPNQEIGGIEIADSYPSVGESNGWFTDFYQLTLQTSLWIFGRDYTHDDRLTSAGLAGREDELNRIQAEGAAFTLSGSVRGWMPEPNYNLTGWNV